MPSRGPAEVRSRGGAGAGGGPGDAGVWERAGVPADGGVQEVAGGAEGGPGGAVGAEGVGAVMQLLGRFALRGRSWGGADVGFDGGAPPTLTLLPGSRRQGMGQGQGRRGRAR